MAYLVGIAGGTGSGKGTITDLIQKNLELWGVSVQVLSTDDCYKDFSYMNDNERDALCFDPSLNFDHPKSVNIDRLVAYAGKLKRSENFSYPKYDFSTHSYSRQFNDSPITVEVPADIDVGIIEGIFSLYNGPEFGNRLLDQYDYTLFISTMPEIAMNRRYLRDSVERGRDMAHIGRQMNLTVIPMHRKFVYPQELNADDTANWQVSESGPRDQIKEKLARLARQKSLSIYEAINAPLLDAIDVNTVKIKGLK